MDNLEIVDTWLIAQGFIRGKDSVEDSTNSVDIVFNARQNYNKVINETSNHGRFHQRAHITSYIENSVEEVVFLLMKTTNEDHLTCNILYKIWRNNDRVILKDLNHKYYSTMKECIK